MSNKKISVLGSTGSIGVQTLQVAEHLNFEVFAIAAQKNISLLEKQIRKFKPKFAAVFEKDSAKELRENVKDLNIKILEGLEGLCEIAALEEVDIPVVSISGLEGLKPTLSAINAGKNVALANKETLVSGGDVVMAAARKKGVQILPIDSEHSAIFQCLRGTHDKNSIKKIILTASGGPFFGKKRKELSDVTSEMAIKHPSWSMGKKISVDSATLMNKGLELIEAIHLFDVLPEQIEIVVHPQSVVHSMVEFCDGSVLAQMGVPNMVVPIQYALTYPERKKSLGENLNFSKIKNLNFFEPDYSTFEAPKLCRDAIKIGGTAPAILNAANEKAVHLFLKREIRFTEIIDYVKEMCEKIKPKKIEKAEDIFEAHDAVFSI